MANQIFLACDKALDGRKSSDYLTQELAPEVEEATANRPLVLVKVRLMVKGLTLIVEKYFLTKKINLFFFSFLVTFLTLFATSGQKMVIFAKIAIERGYLLAE